MRLRQGIRLQTADNMNVRHLQKPPDLPFPVLHQMCGYNQQSRISAGLSQVGKRLHRFAKAHFIRQQRTIVLQQKTQAFLLKLHQFSMEQSIGRLCLQRILVASFPGQDMLSCLGHLRIPPFRIPDLQGITEHQPV